MATMSTNINELNDLKTQYDKDYERYIERVRMLKASTGAIINVKPKPVPQYVPALRAPIPENAAKFPPEWFARYELEREKLLRENGN